MYIIVDTECEPVPMRFYDNEYTFDKEVHAMDILRILQEKIGNHYKVINVGDMYA